jgi:multiple sugar transport system ATP-binding protein
MAKVTLQNLVKTYPASGTNSAFTAVKGIDLEIRDGEFMVLVGPSGCGKSTTLRMIAGLEDASSGTIMIDDRVINHELSKTRDIAMVFQSYALYPHMDVRANLGFGLKLRGFPKSEIEQRVQRAAVLLGLDTLLDRKPKALSGGQRQRVAVGRAIVRDPKVFLFDEPLSNLDAKMRVSTRTEISKLHATLGTTMIYVTHDQVEAMTMGDRICVMKDGTIMQVAAPLELYNRPANLYVAGFIGSPQMNFFRGVLRQAGDRLSFVETNVNGYGADLTLTSVLSRAAGNQDGRSVVLGVRPENIHAVTAPQPGVTVAARVELVEPMGAETYLHLTTGATGLIARMPPEAHQDVGTMTYLAFSPEKIHLFDAATEQVIR